MEISSTDRMKNEEMLHRKKEEMNILLTTEQRKASWVGHTLHRNCLLQHIIEWKIEGTVRRGRRRQQLLYDLKEWKDTEICNKKH